MSYMILDVMVFLFIFVIVYISFTLSMVYIYAVYSDERTDKFNNHKSAFKLFFWAMIRTGNPQFAGKSEKYVCIGCKGVRTGMQEPRLRWDVDEFLGALNGDGK